MVSTAMSFILLSSLVIAHDKNTEAASSEEKKVVSGVQRELQKHALGIGLGQIFLLGQFESHGDNKISADFLYSYTASYSFDVLLNAHFSDHEYRGKKVTLRGYTMSIKARSYEFDQFSPFVLGGFGFYMPQIQDKDGETSEAKYTFGFNLGGGADLRLNDRVIVGLLTQYHKPFEVKQDETKNVSGSYFKLLITTMYQF